MNSHLLVLAEEVYGCEWLTYPSNKICTVSGDSLFVWDPQREVQLQKAPPPAVAADSRSGTYAVPSTMLCEAGKHASRDKLPCELLYGRGCSTCIVLIMILQRATCVYEYLHELYLQLRVSRTCYACRGNARGVASGLHLFHDAAAAELPCQPSSGRSV